MLQASLVATAILCAVLAGSAPPAAARSERIVLIYENRSGNPAAIDLISSSIGGVLARKGYEVIDDGEVADFQEAMRTSRAEPSSPGTPNKILLRFHADTVLSVLINFVLEGAPRRRGPRASPAIGLTAKLVRQDGSIAWRNSMGVLADDSPLSNGHDTRAGAIRTTVVTGCERLLYTMPKAKPSVLDAPEDADQPKFGPAARRGGPRFSLKPAPVERDRIKDEKKKNQPPAPPAQ